MFNFQSKGISSIGIIIVIVAVVLLSGGLYFYLQKQIPETPSDLQGQEQEEELIVGEQEEEELIGEQEESDSVSNNTNCDNYDCLIAAASQCQPISAIISYSEIPFPLNPDMFASGQTKYEIKKSSGANDCILIISFLSASFTISDKGREAALAQGMTDAQINAQLQTMNDSLQSVAGRQTICPSNASIITTYLTDSKNYLESGNFQFEMSVGSSEATVTYTLSSGQKLICTNEQ
jgi:hypothetical protein